MCIVVEVATADVGIKWSSVPFSKPCPPVCDVGQWSAILCSLFPAPNGKSEASVVRQASLPGCRYLRNEIDELILSMSEEYVSD